MLYLHLRLLLSVMHGAGKAYKSVSSVSGAL